MYSSSLLRTTVRSHKGVPWLEPPPPPPPKVHNSSDSPSRVPPCVSLQPSRESSEGIVTGLRATQSSNRALIHGRVKTFLLFGKATRQTVGPTRPPTPWDEGRFHRAAERLGLEADQSSPSSASVRNAWIYTSIPLCKLPLMSYCFTKQRNSLT